jgi:chitin disaccharide deacetylase
MRIHLQADDAGIGMTATQMILEAWEQGLLNGFGIVANTASEKQIAESLTKNKSLECTLSAHLNLTDGMAQQSYLKGAYIVNQNGRLRIGFVKALYYLFRGGRVKKQFLKEVYSEWDLQLQRIKKICGERKLSVVNGHNHIHMLPSLFSMLTHLAAKYDIPYVRFTKEHFIVAKKKDLTRSFFLVNVFKWIVLSICGYQIKRKKIEHSPLTSEVFGILYSGHVTFDAIEKAIITAKKRKVSSIEIFLHPGQSLPGEMDTWASTQSGKLFFTHPARKAEMDVLKQVQLEQILTDNHN